jgi:A/G-specific adenine glycosylase
LEVGETVEDCIRQDLERLGIVVEVGDHLCTVTHAYSHFRVTLEAHHCTHLGGTPNPWPLIRFAG